MLPAPLHHDQGLFCPVGCSLPAGGGACGVGDGGNADSAAEKAYLVL